MSKLGLVGTVFKEPLFQFLVLGTLLFLLNYFLNDENEQYNSSSNQVEISQQDIERFVYIWKKTHFRLPSEQELNHLIKARIKEEILYREALMLGLDKDDPIIRQRLAHKLNFLSEGFSEQGAPEVEVIEQFYLDNQSTFLSKSRVTFKQIFINLQNEKWTNNSIQILIEQLNSQTIDESKAGDASLLLTSYQNKDQSSITQLFGEEFFQQINTTEIGKWQGPILSSYGGHLVEVSQITPSSQLPLAQVSEQIIQILLDKRREESEQRYYDNLRNNYQVSVAEYILSDPLLTTPLLNSPAKNNQ